MAELGADFSTVGLYCVTISDGVSRLGLGLETSLETRFLKSRSRRSQVSSRSRRISVSSSSSQDFAKVIFNEVLQGVPLKNGFKK